MERGGPFEIFSARWATLITCKKKPGVTSRLYFWYWTKKAIYYILAVWHKGGSPRGEPWGGGCKSLRFLARHCQCHVLSQVEWSESLRRRTYAQLSPIMRISTALLHYNSFNILLHGKSDVSPLLSQHYAEVSYSSAHINSQLFGHWPNGYSQTESNVAILVQGIKPGAWIFNF